MNIGVITGYWSTNVGNAFFQLGAQHALRQVFPQANIFPVPDAPGYLLPTAGNPRNSFDLLGELEMDYLVILGPFIRPEFEIILAPALRKLAQKGTQFLAMGVGMMSYDEGTIGSAIRIIQDLPFRLLITRDTPTFEAFHSYFPAALDGVDVAFFVSDVWTDTQKLKRSKPYVAFNFDQTPEPEFKLSDSGYDELAADLNGDRYAINFPQFRRKWSGRGFIPQVLERMFFPQTVAEQVAGFDIIRTDHRYNPAIPRKLYTSPQTFTSDVPWPYLSIYAGAEATFSNRVHACAATLAYGRPAMLFSDTPRAHLLERAGAKTIKSKLTSIDLDQLASEKQQIIQFIGDTLNA